MRGIFSKQVKYGGHDGGNHLLRRAKGDRKVVSLSGLLVIACGPAKVSALFE